MNTLMGLQVRGVAPLPFDSIGRRAGNTFSETAELARALEPPRREEGAASSTTGGVERRHSEYVANSLHRIARALRELADLCANDGARSAEKGAILVVGDPGQGKTHLFCDVAEKRSRQGLVTVLLMGQHFEARVRVRDQIAKLVGAAGENRDRILDTLERRARATGRPALLMIDALNEGGGLDLWRRRLGGLIREVHSRRWVVLALSCRTQYADLLLTAASRQRLHVVEHRGFQLREDEAIAQFFSYYRLQLPRVPLLLPEYSHPLFLKLLCRALQRKVTSLSAVGKEGIWYLYERFYAGVGEKIAEDLGRPDINKIPWDSAKAIAQEMANQRTEIVSRARALELIVAACREKADPEGMLRAMLDEGLLAEDVSMEGGQPTRIVRFPYQHLAHHLIARYLLGAAFDRKDPVASFAPGTVLGDIAADERTARRSAGLIEALAIQLPEHAPVELGDVIGERARDVVGAAMIASIPWRKVDSFHDVPALLAHLNRALGRRDRWEDLTSAIVSVAPVPDHPLGAQFLHRNLVRRPLPERDVSWTIYLSGQWEASSTIDRVIRWGEHHDHSAATAGELRPLAILVSWFLTSSNRFLRDRATKVLVRFLRRRLGLARDLLDLFENVDDPYVLERIYTAAYGAALLTEDAPAVLELARYIYAHFFGSQGPPTSHILMRDAARGIIERAVALDPSCQREFDPERFRPPYKSPWPLRAPTKKALERHHQGSYAGIYWSLDTSMGDFGKYVVGRALDDMTIIPLSRPFPKTVRRPDSTPSLAEILTVSRGSADPAAMLDEMLAAAATTRPRRPIASRQFPSDRVTRWIFKRVRELGWTPERFETFDRARKYSDTRDTRKEERIGKKYQWIGLHEAVGRVADHVWFREGWGDAAVGVICDGGWEVGLRDLDPTLVTATARVTEMAQTWWQPYPQFSPMSSAAQQRWVESSELPDLRRLMNPTDPAGRRWLTMEAHYQWSDPEPVGARPKRAYARVMWLQIQAYIVDSSRIDEARAYIDRFREHEQPAASLDLRSVFLGELGWHPAYRSVMRMWQRDEAFDVPFERPGERYYTPSEFDCSFPDTVSGYVPGPHLRDSLDLRMHQPFVFGDSAAAAIDPSWTQDGPSVLLVREDAATALLAERAHSLRWLVRGEKHFAYGDERRPRDRRTFAGSFWLDAGRIRGRVHHRLERARSRTAY